MSITRGALTAFPLVSNLTSLANNAIKPLGVVDLSNGFHGLATYLQFTLASSSVSTTGFINLYVMTSEDNANWTDNVSPTTTSDVAASVINSPIVARMAAVANNQVIKYNLNDIADRLGVMPKYLSLLVGNYSGAALSASGHDAKYSTVLYS